MISIVWLHFTHGCGLHNKEKKDYMGVKWMKKYNNSPRRVAQHGHGLYKEE